MMKPRLITLFGLALACLALAGFALRGPQVAASPASETVAAGGRYLLSGAASQPEATTLSGGRYQLSNLPQGQVQRISSGGSYQLTSPTAPTLSENGCCCVYLPCVLR